MKSLQDVDAPALATQLTQDREFTSLTRYLTATMKLRVDDEVMILRISDGVVLNVADVDSGFDAADVVIDVSSATFSEMMQSQPRPFYQDFWSAKFHHGVRIEGDLDLMSAYYGAIRRWGQLMRNSLNGAQ